MPFLKGSEVSVDFGTFGKETPKSVTCVYQRSVAHNDDSSRKEYVHADLALGDSSVRRTLRLAPRIRAWGDMNFPSFFNYLFIIWCRNTFCLCVAFIG